MNEVSTFRLTFHVSHPSVPAVEIENVFGMPVRFSQSANMQKKTKNGKILDGVYKRTNVSFSVHENPLNFNDTSVVGLIQNQLDSFDQDYINLIYKSGGSCHFLIGIFSSNNVMFELNIDIIQRLSTLKISVKFDFYGGAD